MKIMLLLLISRSNRLTSSLYCLARRYTVGLGRNNVRLEHFRRLLDDDYFRSHVAQNGMILCSTCGCHTWRTKSICYQRTKYKYRKQFYAPNLYVNWSTKYKTSKFPWSDMCNSDKIVPLKTFFKLIIRQEPGKEQIQYVFSWLLADFSWYITFIYEHSR